LCGAKVVELGQHLSYKHSLVKGRSAYMNMMEAGECFRAARQPGT
jgi:hypothetical protein